MLNILRFNLCVPTPYVFVVRFLKAAKSDQKVRTISHIHPYAYTFTFIFTNISVHVTCQSYIHI